MQTTLKRLAKLTAGYSLVTLVGPLFTILLTPLYTRVLTPADYGVVEVALTFSALLSVFALGGMDQALSAYFFDGDETFRRNLVTTTLACVCVAGLLLGLLMFAFAHTLAEIFFKTETRYLIFQLLAINMVSSPVYSVIAAALRLRMGVRRVNVLGLAQLFTNVACNIVFVLFLHLRATGIVEIGRAHV